MSAFQKADGMMYAPKGQARAVCAKGEFRFGVIGLDHGHIFGMSNGLVEAGAELVAAYDPDPEKLRRFCQTYPGTRTAGSEAEILEDPSLHLVAAAPLPCDRCDLGLRVMAHGKDYFADKPAFTTLAQLDAARQKVRETGRIFAVYYAERLHCEAAVCAGQLIQEGRVGRVLHVAGFGPHRINAPARPPWFFDRRKTGGILCDLGSHQFEQFLAYAGAHGAQVLHSKVANYLADRYPEFEDFGDASLLADNGATFYCRVDWHTPDGQTAWGDGRTFIIGTQGTLELRKYLDVARDRAGDHVYLVDAQGEHHLAVHGQVGFPYFGALIRDVLDRTEHAMPQAHTFLAAELSLQAQAQALRIPAAL